MSKRDQHAGTDLYLASLSNHAAADAAAAQSTADAAAAAATAAADAADAVGEPLEDLAYCAGTAGSDVTGDGTILRPFASLQAAFDALTPATGSQSSFERLRQVICIGAQSHGVVTVPAGHWQINLAPGQVITALDWQISEAERYGSTEAHQLLVCCTPVASPWFSSTIYGGDAVVTNLTCALNGEDPTRAAVFTYGVSTNQVDLPDLGGSAFGKLLLQHGHHAVVHAPGWEGFFHEVSTSDLVTVQRVSNINGWLLAGDLTLSSAPDAANAGAVWERVQFSSASTITGPAGCLLLDDVSWASYQDQAPTLAGGATAVHVGAVAPGVVFLGWGYRRTSDLGNFSDTGMPLGSSANLSSAPTQCAQVVMPFPGAVTGAAVLEECSGPGGTYTIKLNRLRAGVTTSVTVRSSTTSVAGTKTFNATTSMTFLAGDILWCSLANNGIGTTEGLSVGLQVVPS